jgi:hypothetical protein
VHIVNNCINSDEAHVLYLLWFHCKVLLVDMMRSVRNRACFRSLFNLERDLCICFI